MQRESLSFSLRLFALVVIIVLLFVKISTPRTYFSSGEALVPAAGSTGPNEERCQTPRSRLGNRSALRSPRSALPLVAPDRPAA
jgi:hypothetical protein